MELIRHFFLLKYYMKHIKGHCIELTIATLISKPISSTCTTIGETFICTSSSILTRIRDTVSNIWSDVIYITHKSRDTVSNIWSHVIHCTYKSQDAVSNIWSHVIHCTYKSRDTVSNIWSDEIHCTYKTRNTVSNINQSSYLPGGLSYCLHTTIYK